MSSPKIQSVAELEAQLALNRGWLFLHVGTIGEDAADPSVPAFESARHKLEDRLPISLLRCTLGSSDLRCFPWVADLDPRILAFYRGELLETVRAPERAVRVIEWAQMVYSFHTPDPPRVILEPPSEG